MSENSSGGQNEVKYIEIDGSSDEEEMEESELKKSYSNILEIDFGEIFQSESKVTVDLKTLIKEESIKKEHVDNVPETICIEEVAETVLENEGIHNIKVSHIVSKATDPTPRPVMKPVILKGGLKESMKIEHIDNVPATIGIEEAAEKLFENEGIHNIKVSRIVSKATDPTAPVMKPVLSKEGLEESIKIEHIDNVPETIGIEEAVEKVFENEGIHNIKVSCIVSKATDPTPPVMKPVISKEGLVKWVPETFESRNINSFVLCDMEEKLFGCLRTECAERFQSRAELKSHLAGQHRHKAKEKKQKSSNMCKECGKKFVSLQVLKRHKEMVHERLWAREPYTTLVRLCPECVNPADSCKCEAASEVKQPEHNKEDLKFNVTNSVDHQIASESNVLRSTSEVLAELIDIFQ